MENSKVFKIIGTFFLILLTLITIAAGINIKKNYEEAERQRLEKYQKQAREDVFIAKCKLSREAYQKCIALVAFSGDQELFKKLIESVVE